MLDFYTARLRNLVVDDRWDAVLFRAPHPANREKSDWQPFIWREPIVGWAEVRCYEEPDDVEDLARSTTAHMMSGVIVGEGGELRPLMECDDILDRCLLFVQRREESLDEDAAIRCARERMAAADPTLLEIAKEARERRVELS